MTRNLSGRVNVDKFISGDKVTFINRNHQRVNCQIVCKHPHYDKNDCYIVTTNIEGYYEYLHESRIEKVN